MSSHRRYAADARRRPATTGCGIRREAGSLRRGFGRISAPVAWRDDPHPAMALPSLRGPEHQLLGKRRWDDPLPATVNMCSTCARKTWQDHIQDREAWKHGAGVHRQSASNTCNKGGHGATREAHDARSARIGGMFQTPLQECSAAVIAHQQTMRRRFGAWTDKNSTRGDRACAHVFKPRS